MRTPKLSIREPAGTQLRNRVPCQESSSVRPIERTAVKGELPHHNQHFSRTLLHPDVKVQSDCLVRGLDARFPAIAGVNAFFRSESIPGNLSLRQIVESLTESRSVPICRPAYRDLMTESGQENRILGRFASPVQFYSIFILFEY
jgi:hypothetical protein